jgi:transposase
MSALGVTGELDGDQMAGLCREFGISRKTGYKILKRYNDVGLEGLTDRSRRPGMCVSRFYLGLNAVRTMLRLPPSC